MKYTFAFGALFVAFWIVEAFAWRAGYWHTATGHVVKAMLSHPVVALVILGASFALSCHLLVDYLVLRLRQ